MHVWATSMRASAEPLAPSVPMGLALFAPGNGTGATEDIIACPLVAEAFASAVRLGRVLGGSGNAFMKAPAPADFARVSGVAVPSISYSGNEGRIEVGLQRHEWDLFFGQAILTEEVRVGLLHVTCSAREEGINGVRQVLLPGCPVHQKL